MMIDTIDSPYIHAAEADNFQKLVVENSCKGPVLVNFWSKKAGPCLRQYPVLDKLVHDFKGRMLLINIDVDTEVIVPKQYGVASVPTLKLFRNEEVVETLHGYQSEKDLQKILEKYVARDSDLVLANAIQIYTEGNAKQAYEMIANAIVEDPINPRLPLTICKLLKHEGRYAEAAKLINSLPDSIRDDKEIKKIDVILMFHQIQESAREEQVLLQQLLDYPDDRIAREELIALYMVKQDYEKAINLVIELLSQDSIPEKDYAKKMLLKIFAILGSNHNLVIKYQSHLRQYTH